MAFCAWALLEHSFHILAPGTKAPNSLIVFVFTATLSAYIFCQLNSALITKSNSISRRISWVKEKLFKNCIVLIISSLIFTYQLFKLEMHIFSLVLLFGLVTSMYALKTESLNIREIPYLKLFIIAINWLFLTCFVPILYLKIDINMRSMSFLIGMFAFIITVILPFDLRDYDIDKSVNLKTIPHLISKWGVVLLSLMLSIVFYKFKTQTTPIQDNQVQLLALICALMPLASVGAMKIKNEYYYLVGVDGLCILLFLSTLL